MQNFSRLGITLLKEFNPIALIRSSGIALFTIALRQKLNWIFVVDVICFGAYGTPQDAHEMGLDLEDENLQEATDAALQQRMR
eukprot:2140350-Amphidinium_carterae.1